MLDQYILDWAPAKDFPSSVRSFGRHGPCIVDTNTFGSGTRSGSWADTPPVNQLPLIPAEVVSGEDKDLAVPPAVKAWRLSHANAKIRQEASISRFASCNGGVGALHAARLPSNAPCEDEWDARTAGGLVYAGIYDGHGGSATAKTLKASLIPFVSREIHRVGRDAAPEKMSRAIKTAFTKLDDAILDAGKAALLSGNKPCDGAVMSALAPATAGSCALLSVFDPESSTLSVASVGDSRAVLGSHSADRAKGEGHGSSRSSSNGIGVYEARALSEDQNAENHDEVSRIKAAHPGEEDGDLFQGGRFLGIMVTRAFGDHRWKWDAELVGKAHLEFLGPQARPGVRTPPYLVAEPAVTCTPVSARDFVILASDGFWDHVSTDDAVRLVARWLEQKKKRSEQGRLAAGHGGDDDGVVENATPGGAGAQLDLDFDEDGFAAWKTLPQHFVVEDMDNAAVHLLKNALGGNRRNLFVASTMMGLPHSRNIRDDIAVQVLFFQ
ncbi:protein phosphatase 2C [Cordyceps javanica]|uniref:Protein phosphatase 2C n=1 Tax=Cordyceps javanica TaxID=43265 RepID=A0A545UTL0_9HYPO|nr:protein phosphatase 2C [Cordyceps javanica]TQW02127.1 protein phosphatase 2C [Cordyceps javanica]